MNPSEALIEQAACVTYEAVRGLGLANGACDIPTWQIATHITKTLYRANVVRVIAGERDPEALAKHHCATCSELFITHATADPWPMLSPVRRFHWQLFVAVAGAFAGRTEAVR